MSLIAFSSALSSAVDPEVNPVDIFCYFVSGTINVETLLLRVHNYDARDVSRSNLSPAKLQLVRKTERNFI